MTEDDKRLSCYLDEVERLEALIDRRDEANSPFWDQRHARAAQQASIVMALNWTRSLPRRPALECGCVPEAPYDVGDEPCSNDSGLVCDCCAKCRSKCSPNEDA